MKSLHSNFQLLIIVIYHDIITIIYTEWILSNCHGQPTSNITWNRLFQKDTGCRTWNKKISGISG